MAKTDLILHKETMSSLEISELTGKQHAHVMRDIRALLGQGVSQSNFGLSSYKQSQPNGGYKDVACYELTKKGCLILASGYDALLREKIINRWEELETKLQEMSSPSYMIADPIKRAEKWIEEQKQLKRLAAENEKQAEQIAQDAPRVLFSKAVETAKRSCLIASLQRYLDKTG